MESLVEKSIRIALDAHKGQKDKSNRPYILHPLRIALSMKSDEEFMAAVLHDVLEDSEYTDDDLRRHGFPEEVVKAAVCLCHEDDDDYFAYIASLKSNPIAKAVKLADLQDNLNIMRLSAVSDEDFDRIRKYHKAWLELSGHPSA